MCFSASDVSRAPVSFGSFRINGTAQGKSGWAFHYIQGVPGVKFTTSGFNSRANSESKTSYTQGSNSQRFKNYDFLKYNK